MDTGHEPYELEMVFIFAELTLRVYALLVYPHVSVVFHGSLLEKCSKRSGSDCPVQTNLIMLLGSICHF